MSFLTKFISIGLCLTLICVSENANASIIAQYRVSSTSVVDSLDNNGDPAPHGLWTAGDIFGTNGRGAAFYDIQDDMLFTQYSDGTATLIGNAVNPYGSTAFINLAFGDFMSSLANSNHYKKESGRSYNANLHDFYGSVSGNISFNGGQGITMQRFVRYYKFQMGLGANAKSRDEFGASAWLQSDQFASHHWDLNLQFTPVPEPATVLIWAGLIGGAFYSSRRRS